MTEAPAFMPPGAQVPQLHVEIVRYTGKNGGFATQMVPLWLPRLVSPAGCRRRCSGGSYGGSTDYASARREAESWAEFLGGVPIIHRTGPATPAGHEPLDASLVLDQDPATATTS